MPAKANLARPHASPSGSENSTTFSVIDRAERCPITKSLFYTNKPLQWIPTALGDADSKVKMEKFIIDLGIVDGGFEFDDPCNVVNLDRFVHKSFEYAFITVTCTSETLNELIKMLKEDNDIRQLHLDQEGIQLQRRLDMSNARFLNPQYELVALHPEHFLPSGSVFTCYNPAQRSHKTYVPSPDRRLRESPGDLSCAPFPPFSGPSRQPGTQLNPFLVMIHAEIRFRRYYRIKSPPSQPLPDDVLELMKRTKELVDLIYWKPEVKPGSYAEHVKLTRQARKRKAVRTDRGNHPQYEGTNRDVRRRKERDSTRPEDPDLETRIERDMELMSGHDLEFTAEDEAFLQALHNGELPVPQRPS